MKNHQLELVWKSHKEYNDDNKQMQQTSAKEYKTRHDWVGKVIQKFKFEITTKCYMYKPEIQIWHYYQMLYVKTRIPSGEWDTQNSMGFWDTKRSPKPSQKTISNGNWQK